jgi:tetratricopeptide (TPR) repeat protein
MQNHAFIWHGQSGDIELVQGHPAEALKSYQAALDMVERLAKADPENAGWQSAMSLFYGKVGDAQLALSNWAEALAAYHACVDTADRVAKSHPDDPERELDVAFAHNKLALALRQENQTSEAREAFAVARGILADLVGAHPRVARFKGYLDWVDQQIAALEN